MNLKVLLPTEVLVDQEVAKVTAEAENGSFCLLPRHIDFVAALPPGLLAYETQEGQEVFLAVDQGVLVKAGPRVLVSLRNAVIGEDLGELRRMVVERFRTLDDRERSTRTVLAKLEGSFVRHFVEYQEHGR